MVARTVGDSLNPAIQRFAVRSSARRIPAKERAKLAELGKSDRIVHVSDIGEVTERKVRDAWSNTPIFSTKLPPDIPTLLEELEKWYFIVEEQKEEQKKQPLSMSSLSAPEVQAAFMLLSIVQSLGEQTWYIVDEGNQEVIEELFAQMRECMTVAKKEY